MLRRLLAVALRSARPASAVVPSNVGSHPQSLAVVVAAARVLVAPYSSRPVQQRIDELVRAKKVVVFMKGVPQQPQCGFSRAVCLILDMHGVKDFDAHNVLADDELRQGIKEYSNWPTLPQVFFNGEFVGGCDIMMEMHKNGELVERLREVGITSSLASAGGGSNSSPPQSQSSTS